MHEERLRQLRRVVEEAPAERFDMAWLCRLDKCGTAHCAAGWAVLDPWFQQETPILDHFTITHKSEFRVLVTAKSFEGAFPGLAQIFGLELTEAHYLFGANLYGVSTVSQSKVLANIDRVLQGKQAVSYRRDYDDP
jgi:hypothetical protein